MKSAFPYVNFAGNTEEAFNFYKTVFGGEFAAVMRFGDGGAPGMPEDAKDKIMHISLEIGGGIYLMGTDALEACGQTLTVGNNVHICLNPDSREESDRVFSALSEGGDVKLPLQDMFWGAYYGQVTDRFGIHWMINFHGA